MIAWVPWPNANRTSKQHYRMATHRKRKFGNLNNQTFHLSVCQSVLLANAYANSMPKMESDLFMRSSNFLCLFAYLKDVTTQAFPMEAVGVSLCDQTVLPLTIELSQTFRFDGMFPRVVMAPFRRRIHKNSK